MKATLNRDDYRTFTQKVQVLESKGYDLPHMVEHKRNSDTFIVTIQGNHDVDVLDGLTDE
tara:strand:+ start:123 stop:302 length:180 start_codon:yes stop_codon:yes gene_type:complete